MAVGSGPQEFFGDGPVAVPEPGSPALVWMGILFLVFLIRNHR